MIEIIIYIGIGMVLGGPLGWKVRELVSPRIDKPMPRPVYIIEPRRPREWQRAIDQLNDRLREMRLELGIPLNGRDPAHSPAARDIVQAGSTTREDT